ncbi:MAG: hypothetical protein ACRDYW_05745 [Acidimicrobiales bacterium]
MHASKARLAAVITALASLTFVGAALAQEPDDPELAEEVTPVECVDDTTDDTTDDATEETVEGTEETVEDDTTDDEAGTDATDDPCEDDQPEAPEGDDVTPEVDEVVEQADDVAPVVEGEWENHGAYVSEQARVGCWEASEEYANHGECVREAAHSDIGKPAKGDAVEGEADSVEATDDADDGGAPAKKAKGAGGKGRGKG